MRIIPPAPLICRDARCATPNLAATGFPPVRASPSTCFSRITCRRFGRSRRNSIHFASPKSLARATQICVRALWRRRPHVSRPEFRVYAGEVLCVSFFVDDERLRRPRIQTRLEVLARSSAARWPSRAARSACLNDATFTAVVSPTVASKLVKGRKPSYSLIRGGLRKWLLGRLPAKVCRSRVFRRKRIGPRWLRARCSKVIPRDASDVHVLTSPHLLIASLSKLSVVNAGE